MIVIEPYVLAMEDNDTKGKTLKSTHIAESIMAAVAPLEKAKSSPEARFAQLHKALKTSHAAGFRHVLIIEEAHSLPIPTLKQLKRLRELEAGFTKLVSIILIGQPELGTKLSPRNGDVREVVQRIEIVELEPLPVAAVEKHLEFRFGRVGKPLTEVVDASGIQALIERLSTSGRDKTSQLYPLAIGNLMIAAMNLAVHVGEQNLVTECNRYNDLWLQFDQLRSSSDRLCNELAVMCEAQLVGDHDLVMRKVEQFTDRYRENFKQAAANGRAH